MLNDVQINFGLIESRRICQFSDDSLAERMS